jgi:Uncharacterized proteins, homologs of microcin C7 resistance protein MccF
MLVKKLNYGDTIGIVCPASPEDDDFIQAHIDILGSLGFNIKKGEHIFSKKGHLAGEDANRATDIMKMFLDDEVDAIMCFRGGYGTMRILPLLDYKIIKQHPKIFIGYSDITTLLNHIAVKCNFITFHGPMVNSDFYNKYTLNSLYSTLMHGDRPYSISNPEENPISIMNMAESISGKLVGGNLTLLCNTLGTKYEVKTDNKILFVEEVGEVPYKIDRMLTQLILAGKLKTVKGFILGQFTDCDPSSTSKSLSLLDVLEDRILSLNKPTFANFMCGHGNPKLTLPIGANVKLNMNTKSIDVLQAVVK